MVGFYLSVFIATALGFAGASVVTNPTDTAPIDPEFVCPTSDGQFPDPSNCSAYYNCWDGAWTRQHCQPNLHFDAKVGYCNWKSAVQCNITSHTPVNTTQVPRSKRPRIISQISTESPVVAATFSTDPTPFVNGAPFTTPGEITTHLNESSLSRSQASKHVQPASNLTFAKLTLPGVLYPSPCKTPNGQFVDPKNCSSYYNCWKGDWIHVECPRGLYFDDVRKYCNWHTQVNCVNVPVASPFPGNDQPAARGYGPTQIPPIITTEATYGSATQEVPGYGGGLPPTYQSAAPMTTTVLLATSTSPSYDVGQSSSTLPQAPATNYQPFTGTYPPPLYSATTVTLSSAPAYTVNQALSTLSPTVTNSAQDTASNNTVPVTVTASSSTTLVTVPTSPYYPLINYGSVSNLPDAISSASSTAVPVSSTAVPDIATTAWPVNQPTTPVSFKTFNTFAPFNGFSAMSTLFPWVNGNSDSNQGGADTDGVEITTVAVSTVPSASIGDGSGVPSAGTNVALPVGDMSSNLELGSPPYNGIFNNLTYPAAPTAVANEFNDPSQTKVILNHPDSGTVVYVTNNIMTTITVANRTLNGTGDSPVGQLRLLPVVMNERVGPFRCPQAFGLYPDPKDCSAYISCWRGTWTRLYCKSGSVFDQERNGCTDSWDTPRGCKMIRPDSPTPHDRKPTTPEANNAVDQNELEKEEPNHHAQPSVPHLFSPQNVGVTETATFKPVASTVVYHYPTAEEQTVIPRKVLQPGPRQATLRPFFVKRSASNELEGDEYVCPEREGLFQHDSDCSAFWNCGDGVGYLQTCPKPLMFDVNAKRCEWFRGGECVDGSIVEARGGKPMPDGNPPARTSPTPQTTRPPTPTFFQCPSRHGVFAHPFDCVKYYSCHEWKPTVRVCEDGKLFSKSHGRCENARHVKCSHDGVIPNEEHKFRCPLKTGYFSDPANCGRFYQCVDHFAYHINCPGSLVFNSQIKVCDWPAYVTCETGARVQPTVPRHGPAHVPSPLPSVPTVAPRPAGDFKCPKPSGKFNHPRVDGSFYECVNGLAFLKNCPADHTFIANLRLCMPNSILHPAAGTRPTQPPTSTANPTTSSTLQTTETVTLVPKSLDPVAESTLSSATVTTSVNLTTTASPEMVGVVNTTQVNGTSTSSQATDAPSTTNSVASTTLSTVEIVSSTQPAAAVTNSTEVPTNTAEAAPSTTADLSTTQSPIIAATTNSTSPPAVVDTTFAVTDIVRTTTFYSTTAISTTDLASAATETTLVYAVTNAETTEPSTLVPLSSTTQTSVSDGTTVQLIPSEVNNTTIVVVDARNATWVTTEAPLNTSLMTIASETTTLPSDSTAGSTTLVPVVSDTLTTVTIIAQGNGTIAPTDVTTPSTMATDTSATVEVIVVASTQSSSSILPAGTESSINVTVPVIVVTEASNNGTGETSTKAPGITASPTTDMTTFSSISGEETSTVPIVVVNVTDSPVTVAANGTYDIATTESAVNQTTGVSLTDSSLTTTSAVTTSTDAITSTTSPINTTRPEITAPTDATETPEIANSTTTSGSETSYASTDVDQTTDSVATEASTAASTITSVILVVLNETVQPNVSFTTTTSTVDVRNVTAVESVVNGTTETLAPSDQTSTTPASGADGVILVVTQIPAEENSTTTDSILTSTFAPPSIVTATYESTTSSTTDLTFTSTELINNGTEAVFTPSSTIGNGTTNATILVPVSVVVASSTDSTTTSTSSPSATDSVTLSTSELVETTVEPTIAVVVLVVNDTTTTSPAVTEFTSTPWSTGSSSNDTTASPDSSVTSNSSTVNIDFLNVTLAATDVPTTINNLDTNSSTNAENSSTTTVSTVNELVPSWTKASNGTSNFTDTPATEESTTAWSTTISASEPETVANITTILTVENVTSTSWVEDSSNVTQTTVTEQASLSTASSDVTQRSNETRISVSGSATSGSEGWFGWTLPAEATVSTEDNATGTTDVTVPSVEGEWNSTTAVEGMDGDFANSTVVAEYPVNVTDLVPAGGNLTVTNGDAFLEYLIRKVRDVFSNDF